MRHDLAQFSGVIAQVHEASLDASVWPSALDAACEFVGASMAVLGSYAARDRHYELEIYSGYEPRWIELYQRQYAALNPLRHAALGQPVGEVRCLSQYGLIDAFKGDPMYEGWVRPQDILDIAEVIVDRGVDSAAFLSFTRKTRDGVFGTENLERINLLFPHVRQSLLVNRVLNMHRRGELQLATLIDELASGVFLVGEAGRILRTNAAGRDMLSKRSPAVDLAGILRLADSRADRLLAEALHAMDGAAVPAVPLIIEAPDRTRFVVHILSLTKLVAERDLSTANARAAVFIQSSQRELNPALDALATAHTLTPAERRVARALVEVGSTPMIAAALGVTVATVRTHLRSLYAKTGARRQADIVRLLQEHVSPFLA